MISGENQFNTYGRAPVKLLDILQKDKADHGEVMMDYSPGNNFGHLYMKSKTTNDIYDLQQKLGDVSKETASDIKVVIDGEITTLYDLLYTVKMSISQNITATPAGVDIIYMQKQFAYDQISIETKNNVIQLKGFDSAQNLRIPIKMDGIIKWVTTSDLSYIMNSGISTNPDDGKVSSVLDIYPENDKIYLLASKRHLTKYLTNDTSIILPETTDAFVEISWCVITNSIAPKLTFAIDDIDLGTDKIKWGAIAPNLVVNSTHVFTFKTWTNGNSWVANVEIYSN